MSWTWMMTMLMMSLVATMPAEAKEPERWLRFLPKEPVEVVVKPTEPATAGSASPTTAASTSAGAMQDARGRVDLNRADVETLDAALAGVGRAKAEAIVAWRGKHGPFRSVEQLDEVPGFGPKLVERNRDRVFVK